MLVLSRKVNESLVLTVGTKQILIYVTKIEGDNAKLGITAPADVKVYRKELWDDIMQNNVEALRSSENITHLPKLSPSTNKDTVEIQTTHQIKKPKPPTNKSIAKN